VKVHTWGGKTAALGERTISIFEFIEFEDLRN